MLYLLLIERIKKNRRNGQFFFFSPRADMPVGCAVLRVFWL
jgi:hypothetical protein